MGIIATEPPPTYRYKDAQELLSEKEPWAIIHIFVLKYLTKKAIDETWPWIEKLEEALPYEQSISQLTKSKSIIEFSVAIQNELIKDFENRNIISRKILGPLVPELEQMRDKLESLLEDIELALDPTFRNCIRHAISGLPSEIRSKAQGELDEWLQHS